RRGPRALLSFPTRRSSDLLRERSPLATAMVTSEMLRTWAVRLDAIWLTESVRSFHTPDTPSTLACPPRRPAVPTSSATRVTSERSEEHTSELQSRENLVCR